jgi:secreted PhoX family phosphatase
MPQSRRHFLTQLAAGAVAFGGLRSLIARSPNGQLETQGKAQDPAVTEPRGWGALQKDPKGILDLPKGFGYTIFSRKGERMDDGLFVPAAHDGMATFAGPDGRTILIRNHENSPGRPGRGPFGERNELLEQVAADHVYDLGRGDAGPGLGGTTTLIFDTRKQRLEKHWLSLAGTERNCAGGPTPWNSWVTCEETVSRRDRYHAVDHGYCFEVPATAQPGLVAPVPLKDMGRMNHEAICVDPATGIVYQTEDRGDSLIYRYLPKTPGKLQDGGVLQALVVEEHETLDTRNWKDAPTVRPGDKLRCRWVRMENLEAPKDDLRLQGASKGAAVFARGEGMWWGNDACYFTCTSGGQARKGQIFRYVPDAPKPDVRLEESGGTLELFVEPNDASVLENCDNMCVAPFGDLIVCEDGPNDEHIVGVTPAGDCYQLARNSLSEFAGACFSPDGSTLFVNIQGPGLSLAITGPWPKR